MKTTLKHMALCLITGLAPLLSTPRLVRRRRAVSVAIANEVPDEVVGEVCNAVGPTVEGALNDDGLLVMTVPYGEWPNIGTVAGKKKKLVQMVNKEAAQRMADVFNEAPGILAKVKRFLNVGGVGPKDVPLYIGHPDAPGSGDKDGAAYGWLKAIVANEDAMQLHFEVNADGLALVNSKKFRFYSPHWNTAMIDDERTTPVVMRSVGLTNQPAIPVAALTNELEPEPQAPSPEPQADSVANCCGCNASGAMKRSLREKLYMEPDATDEQVLAALDARAAEVRRMEADLAALRAQLATEQAARVTVANELAGVQSLLAEKSKALVTISNAVQTTKDELATVKTALVQNELKPLQAAGKLKPADYDGTVARLVVMSNEAMREELQALAASKPAMKTESAMGDKIAAEAKAVTIANEADAPTTKAAQRSQFIGAFVSQPALAAVPVNERRRLAWRALKTQHPEWCD